MNKYGLKKLYINFLLFKRAFKNYPFRKFNIIEILLFWIKSKLSRSQFLVLSGILVGFSAGFAGVVLKTFVHSIQSFLNNDLPFTERLIAYAVFPLAGIVLTALIVKFFYGNDQKKEISFVLNDIAQNESKVHPRKMHSQIIQSAVTVGFGGSAGLETPIAITGSAIGSNYAQRYRLGYKERTLLLAAGAAAGIASAFNAPIAGVMFAFEILLTGLVFSDFIPLVIAAICGSLISHIILQEDILFSLHARQSFDYVNTFYYIALGIVTGFYARYFLVISEKVKHYFDRYKGGNISKAVIGGSILSILCVAFPPLFGEGYINIKMLHQGNINFLIHQEIFSFFGSPNLVIVVFLLLTIMLKAVATSVTLNSGGNGGNFAPSLIAGGLLGFVFGFSLSLLGIDNVPIPNLMLVGMAGVMSGVLYAPLTAIFLIAESSSGYDLFIPLMIVSVISFLINKFFSSVNPAFRSLAADGKIFTTRHDQNILHQIQLMDCINGASVVINLNSDIHDVLNTYRNSNQNTFAVVDEKQRFWGILNREQLRPYLLGTKPAEEANITELTLSPSFLINTQDRVADVIKMFDESDVWQLPLLNDKDEFLGFISRSKILTKYRLLLKEYSE